MPANLSAKTLSPETRENLTMLVNRSGCSETRVIEWLIQQEAKLVESGRRVAHYPRESTTSQPTASQKAPNEPQDPAGSRKEY